MTRSGAVLYRWIAGAQIVLLGMLLLPGFTRAHARALPRSKGPSLQDTHVRSGATAPCYDWIVRDKIRAGYMSSSDLGDGLARMKSVGMNAILPKFGRLEAQPTAENARSLADWGRAARQSGLHLFPVINFRGGASEPIPSSRREVTMTGQTMRLTPCPLDEEFWKRYVLGRMTYLAEHASADGLAGAVLDPEMYGADHTSYATVCYCPDCMREFFQAAGREAPNPLPPPGERAAWLRQNGLEQRFEQRFVDRVKGFCQRVERECHAKNPAFVLGTLHPDIEGPFTRGLVIGLGTERYPLLGFSEMTYSNGYTDYVASQQRAFSSMRAYVLFVPGIWQQQFPSENLAEQYYACAAHSSGYWVYTFESLLEDVSKMPGYGLSEPADRYWAALKTANEELGKLTRSRGAYVSMLQVRLFDPPLPVIGTADIKVEAFLPAPDARPRIAGPLTRPRMRYRSPAFILGQAGEPVAVRVTNVQLSRYRPGTQWVVLGPAGTRLAEGHMKVKESAEVKFTPDRDGVYLLVLDSGSNSHTFEMLTGQRYASPATRNERFTVNGSFGRMYFYVPRGARGFSFFAKAEGQAPGRGGKLTMFDPDGKSAAHVEGDLGTLTETPVPVPTGADGRVWCLSADGLTNDLTVYFSADGVAPYLTPDPAKVLALRP